MRIERIEVHQALMPVVDGTYRTARAAVDTLDSTLVRIVTDTGLSGWGETCPLGPTYQPHHALGVRAGLEQICPGLVGGDVPSPRVLQRRVDALLAGHGYVKAALDVAVLDLHGQHLGVPVSTLLGGAPPRRPRRDDHRRRHGPARRRLGDRRVLLVQGDPARRAHERGARARPVRPAVPAAHLRRRVGR